MFANVSVFFGTDKQNLFSASSWAFLSLLPKHCGCPCTLTFLYSIPITKQALASFSSIFFSRCPRSTWFRFDAELLRVILRRVKYLLILTPGRPRRAESQGIIKGVELVRMPVCYATPLWKRLQNRTILQTTRVSSKKTEVQNDSFDGDYCFMALWPDLQDIGLFDLMSSATQKSFRIN